MSSDDATDYNESTPLLGSHSSEDGDRPRLICNPSLWLMIIVFAFGSAIGGYLLYIQGQDYPISKPFFLVRRSKWGSASQPSGQAFSSASLSCVLVTQVSNGTCGSIASCSKIVRDIQKCDKTGDVEYNFLVGGDGNTYEGQGWTNQSLLELPSTDWINSQSCLVLAFIGNFTASLPNRDQLDEARVWIVESIFRNRLREQYSVFGLRNLTRAASDGESLFRAISAWPHYNSTTGAYL